MLCNIFRIDALFLEVEQIFEILHFTFKLIDSVRVVAVELSWFDLQSDMICALYEFESADSFVHVLAGR